MFFKLSEKNICMKEFLLNSENNPICFTVSNSLIVKPYILAKVSSGNRANFVEEWGFL
jgi:hypothetical protein